MKELNNTNEKRTVKRKYYRFQPANANSMKFNISYMDNKIPCELEDLSLGGAGVIIDSLPFSLIDNSTIKIIINASEFNQIEVLARVVYSHKTTNDYKNPRSRKYGLEFLLQSNKQVETLIEHFC